MKTKLIVVLLALLPLYVVAARFVQNGKATYYANYLEGRKTTSGERYDPDKMTAAHASLPLQTYVKVKNVKNGVTVYLKINDRMSRKSRFILDVSKAAAHKLDIVRAGMGQVQITKVTKEEALAALEEEIK